MSHLSIQEDQPDSRRCPRIHRGLYIPTKKQEVPGPQALVRLAHAQPVTIETEILLADRQQPVTMGTLNYEDWYPWGSVTMGKCETIVYEGYTCRKMGREGDEAMDQETLGLSVYKQPFLCASPVYYSMLRPVCINLFVNLSFCLGLGGREEEDNSCGGGRGVGDGGGGG